MGLRDIVGQERALCILRGSIKKNRISHAYLFTGERGIGKRLTAINFAKTLNCLKRVTSYELGVRRQNSELRIGVPKKSQDFLGCTLDCCDKCPSCRKIDKAIHPDVLFIKPEGDGRQITIEVIRNMEEFLSYKSFEGGWKIVIIDSAEALNPAAANSFLKTLEEPPPQSLLILISSMPELIPDTIRSRCQRINFSTLPPQMIIELLKQNFKPSPGRKDLFGCLSNSTLMLISKLSSGRVALALSEDLLERRERSLQGFKILLGDIEATAWEDRASMEEWFEWAELWLRDIAVFTATGRADLLINHDREEEIKEISRGVRLKDILTLSERLNGIKGLLRFNLNKELTFYYTGLLLKRALGRIDDSRCKI